MVLGSNYDAPIHELLNDNPNKRKVVDLCTGAGHWYVVCPSGDTRWCVDGAITLITVSFQGIGDGKRISPRRVPRA
jgi:hypothetical protein